MQSRRRGRPWEARSWAGSLTPTGSLSSKPLASASAVARRVRHLRAVGEHPAGEGALLEL
eukprot:CAMPEP_0177357266 /NCGR_PEP_ID=MMETSP0368-20130122/34970_1 /TAXON_ID=447022 ORGANISM="Scrippsiella hangoei-like, Strain SHHI-4" /NCGR_SAMPLE_ID=MMETSP0368 /ASSEMBLY_ACC=CAM_ASM_000363 /LENGTH=59 /DNA_ID=CAMNT_0018819659 /DNA_START=62 /DNA_END=238 /DNA_ORIENTATION=+